MDFDTSSYHYYDNSDLYKQILNRVAEAEQYSRQQDGIIQSLLLRVNDLEIKTKGLPNVNTRNRD